MQVAIIGGGIAGLSLALQLHKRGISCHVFEAVPELKELGVGITLLPHAVRELTALGLGPAIAAAGIENLETRFFNRFGQLLYQEPRGKFANYPYPEFGIHRGRLHRILHEATCERLGASAVETNRRCIGIEQDGTGVTVRLEESSSGRPLDPVRATLAVGCDGVHSTVRRQFYPHEEMVFSGINSWRGVTRHRPILTGRTYLRIGSLRTGKIVVYPIIDNIDGTGLQLINWTTEIQSDTTEKNDWNKPGRLEDFIDIYQDWHFDWLDVPALIRNSEVLLEYPMVDKDPIERWTFGRITIAGDAAHPMYPRGSNGSAQALIDVRVLADLLEKEPDPERALAAYEAARTGPTAKVVRANRENPPDFINLKVEELTGDRPFGNLDDFISQDELRTLSDQYKRIAGFALSDLR